jgi:hypothetical protein
MTILDRALVGPPGRAATRREAHLRAVHRGRAAERRRPRRQVERARVQTPATIDLARDDAPDRLGRLWPGGDGREPR